MAAQPQRYPFLLESTAATRVASGGLPLNATAVENARYSLLFGFPQQSLEARAGSPVRRIHGDKLDDLTGGFLSELAAERLGAADSVSSLNQSTSLPFSGGWFLYFAYEFAKEIEPSLVPPVSHHQRLAVAVRIPLAIVLDHLTNTAWLVCEDEFSACSEQALADIEQIHRQADSDDGLQRSVQSLKLQPDGDAAVQYLANVAKAKRYIYDGDVFQANLSRPWRAALDDDFDAISAYQRLASANPAAFAGLALLPGQQIISSSPERLVSIKAGRVNTRPIAGTHARGDSLEEDQTISASLLAHPKEQAEHVMLIDLERNDLGRVCQAGTVKVDELMALESYAYVHHIVSSVSGDLAEGKSAEDVIRATFPGGTITGCPKVRCMEIIAELEQQPRGAYTGSMGYLNHNGDMDLNILIRSLDADTGGGQIQLRAGAGIVADSVPEKELAETAAKAKGLLKAFGA